MDQDAFENKDVLHSDVNNSVHKVTQLMETSDKDESGIGEDMNVSSNADTSGWSCSNLGSVSDCNNHATPVCLSGSEGAGTENSFSFGSLKKDDSGIYSEKSPNVTSPKEASDGEFSESMSESLEDNQCTVNFKQDNVEKTESDVPANNTASESSFNNVVLSNENDSKVETQDNKDMDDVKTTSKCCDAIFEQQDEEMLSSETKEDIACDEAGSDEKESDLKGECKKTSDSEDGSQKEDEAWADLVKNVIKVSSGNKRLVDYDDTDSESEQAQTSVTVKGHRRYRKRKPDTDDTVESPGAEAQNKDKDADNEDRTDDATPVLLRHSLLPDSPQGLGSLDHDSFSDSSNHEVETKESSESESEETPMDLSEFGPPKHKWKALFDLRHREYGYSTSTPADYFMRKVQGSLQMVQRFDLQFKMDRHEGCVNALHFNKTGTLLASGSDDLNIVVWNWIRNRPVLVYDSGHRSNVFQSKFMPFSGDCHIVSCARDGQVRVAYLSTTGVCKSTKKIAQHRGAAHKLALEMDSPHIFLSCGEDAVTFEIDLREDKPHKLVTTKENDKKVAMYSIHSNPFNSNEFCLGGRDHFIRVYDKRKINEEVDDGLLKKFAPDHIAANEKENMKANVTCACYNYNGTELLGTYNDEDIYLFSNEHSDSANYIHRYRGHRNNQTVKGVNFYGPKSEFIVSGSDCGHIFLWDKETENIVQHMQGDDGGVINVLEPHPYAPVLATSGLDQDVKIWAPTAEHPTELKGLKKLTKRNQKEREEERNSDGGMIEGSMLWFIMNQLRRGRRRRERQARANRGDEDDNDSDSVSEEDLTASEDSDSEGSQVERIQCNPS